MLSKPEHGRSNVTIGDFTASASYLVDIPFEWLNACKFSLADRLPLSLFIEEEGSRCFITSYDMETYIIRDDGEMTSRAFYDICYLDIAEELIRDVKMYFEDRVKWSPYEKTKDDHIRRRKELNDLIDSVTKIAEKMR